MFREGLQIGPYTLVSRLGRGGFGEVGAAEIRGVYTPLRRDGHADPGNSRRQICGCELCFFLRV